MRRILSQAGMMGLLALTACTDPAVEQRIADLEKKVEELEKRPAGPAAAGPAASEADEKAAGELLQAAQAAVDAGKADEAKAKLGEMEAKFGNTKTFKRAGRLKAELEVFGVDAGAPEVDKWFQGNGNFTDGKITLLVFWETWCPHCQREVPKLEETYTKFKSKGLNVVAFTKVNKSSTDEKVTEFIKEHKLTFPVGKEKDASMSNRFGVQGIPAAAVVKNGKVIWRGHPARLDDAKLESLLAG